MFCEINYDSAVLNHDTIVVLYILIITLRTTAHFLFGHQCASFKVAAFRVSPLR